MKMGRRRAVSFTLAILVTASCVFCTGISSTQNKNLTAAADDDYFYVPTNLYKYDRSGSTMAINQATLDAANAAKKNAESNTDIRALYFDKASLNYGDDWNQFHTPGSALNQGLVKDELRDGKLQWNSDGKSYQYVAADLFNSENETQNYRKDFTDLSFPLKREIDSNDTPTGYYSFDSSTQRAKLDQKNKNINIEEPTDIPPDFDHAQYSPFYDGDGDLANQDQQCSFGMDMHMQFTVPEGGKVYNASTKNFDDMKFSFAGDDDVWIFVDGKLVLDLGGIHQPLMGSIDFAISKYSIWDYKPDSGWQESVPADWDKPNGTQKGLNYYTNNKSFDIEPKSTHTLTVYYLERGAGMSNFRMKCNLQQSSSFEVGKELVGKTAPADTTKTYQFQVCSNGDPITNQPYEIYNTEGGTYAGSNSTDGKGELSLASGQKAVFRYHAQTDNAIDASRFAGQKITFTETGQNADQYDTTWQTTGSSTVCQGPGKTKDITAPPDNDIVQKTGVVFTNKLPTDITSPIKTAVQKPAGGRTYDITLTTSTVNNSSDAVFHSVSASQAEKNTDYYQEANTDHLIRLVNVAPLEYEWEDADTSEPVSVSVTKENLLIKNNPPLLQYNPTYNINILNDYYVQGGNGTYIEVSYLIVWFDKNINIYSPKKNSNDTKKGHTQFYEQTPVDYSLAGTVPTKPDGNTYYIQNESGYEPVNLKDVSTAVYRWVDSSGTQLTRQPTTVYQLASDAQTTQPITGATVRDTIDPRFEVVGEDGNVLTKDTVITTSDDITATLHVSQPGLAYVEWTGQTIPVAPNQWSQTIHIKAKDEFIGGNDIPTNDYDSSYVSFTQNEKNVTKPFSQPTVNVPIRFSMDDATQTIFLGEQAPPVKLEPYTTKEKDMFCGKDPTGSFSYQWTNDADQSKLDGTTGNTFPSGQKPTETAHYTLTATFTPFTDGTDSRRAGGGEPEAATSGSGKYTVNVVKGELDLTKIMNAQYPTQNPGLVNPRQSFVFKITWTDPDAICGAPEIFYEVITPSTSGNIFTGSKKITGLKKGVYTVTEVNGVAWRYKNSKIEDSDDYQGGTNDGAVYIGREMSPGNYFGSVGSNSAWVNFTNTLNDFQWVGDTTVAVNTITNS